MKRNDAAGFTEEIILQTRTEDDQNAFGEDFGAENDGTWDDAAPRWAAVTLKSQQSQWIAGNQIVEATHLVEAWYDDELAVLDSQQQRLKWIVGERERILRVIIVEDIGNRHQRLALVCAEQIGAV